MSVKYKKQKKKFNYYDINNDIEYEDINNF